MRLNKKGQHTLLLLFEVVVVVSVVALALSISYRAGSQKTVQKQLIKNELDFTINSLIATGGDAWVEFPKDISGFVVELEEDSFSVYEKEAGPLEVKPKKVFLPEGWTLKKSKIEDVKKGYFFYLVKSGKNIYLAEEKPKNIFRMPEGEFSLSGAEVYFFEESGLTIGFGDLVNDQKKPKENYVIKTNKEEGEKILRFYYPINKINDKGIKNHKYFVTFVANKILEEESLEEIQIGPIKGDYFVLNYSQDIALDLNEAFEEVLE